MSSPRKGVFRKVGGVKRGGGIIFIFEIVFDRYFFKHFFTALFQKIDVY